MILKDLHIHTSYCDGKNSCEEMVVSAIEKGLKSVGLLFHSYTFFDESYCIKKEKIQAFISEVLSLKEKYRDKIDVLLGVEQDFYAEQYPYKFDYVIGSVHYIKKGNAYLPIDESKECFVDIVNRYYNGDYYALATDYFNTVSLVPKKLKPDIIGHFDLVSKFNEGGVLFWENDKRYVDAYKNAVDRLIAYSIPFEINTGAISRGYKSEAYPSCDILRYIFEKGGRVTLSSDAHSKEYIAFGFDKQEENAVNMGFDIV